MIKQLTFIRRGFLLMIFSLMCFGLWAQVTPPEANTDAECGADCWDLFSWGTVQDGSGNNIPNFSEGLASDANCNTTITATAEYTGADSNGPDLVGTSIGANLQGTSTDSWLLGFGTALTNPVISFSALETTSNVLITDCDGNEITASCFASCGTNLTFVSGVGWSGDVAYSLQLSGTYDCINISVAVINDDAYNFSIGTCLGADPFPPCVSCGANEDFEFINLTNKSGSGTGATADIELNNVLAGTAEVLFSDLDINEDLSGTTFGGFDNDGGTYLLRLEFCEPVTIQQFEIINLEVESEVSIGTTISGTGASATLGGLSLTQCAGSNRMTLNDGAPNLVITDGPGCGANPNASYTVGNITTDVLYFKYRNPDGGCSLDYVGFKIGTCVSDGMDAVPVCPLTYLTYATDIEDYVVNGPDFVGNDANAFQVMRDANGNFFDQNCTQIQNEVENGIAIPTVAISPCAEVVEEEECFFCDPPPPCTDCPVGSEYSFISLSGGTDEDGDGLDEGEVFLQGVCIGTFDVVYSDLDVNEDVSGTQFGGFDRDGGVYVLQLDFCDPLAIQQLDIRNLEVESQVSVGTMISGVPGPGTPATLSGLDLNFCDGSTRMLPEDPPVNLVITDGPGCGANPNASYTLGGASVNTLYFQYYNPMGGCTFDYVGFRIGTCYTPPPMAAPVCPVEIVQVTCDMNDVIANGANNNNTDEYAVDGNGNYFDFSTCNATLQNAVENATMLQIVDIGCAELVSTVEECDFDCTIPPTCAATTCPPENNFNYISLDQNGMNPDGFPMGTVDLDGVKIGTYEFMFSDLDVSLDGNGTTFGGWDNDGGTMLLRLDFCEPLNIQELDIRNLEVNSEVSIGTSISGTGAAAVLSGQSLTVCDDPSGRMGVGPAPNEVITDGPGCGANPNATYTVGTNPVMTLYFKYRNPMGSCRGDYVGFRIAACAPAPVMAAPTCPLTLYEVDDCPNDPNNTVEQYYQDANGNWFPGTVCMDPVDEMTMLETIRISPCASINMIEMCAFCCELAVTCPPTDLGTITCNDAVPAAATTEAEFEALGGDIADMPGPCGMLSITSVDVFNPPADICDGRTLTRTYTISDDNESFTCTQTLTISAPNAPMITCPADMTIECLDQANVDPNDAIVVTDCSQGFNTVISGPVQNGPDDCPGTTYTYTYTTTDDCGRTASCEQVFTIDNEGPMITCPADMTVECFDQINVDPNDVAVVIDCSQGFNTVVSAPVQNGPDDCPGTTYTYTYTTTDNCGRTASCEQVFTIDNEGPMITCPADEVVTCFEDIDADPNNLIVNTSCGLGFFAYVKQPLISGIPGCDGTVYTYIYVVVDDCGRKAECEQQFLLQNSTPTIDVPAGGNVECFEDIEVSEGDATVTTDCAGDFTLTILPPTFSGPASCPGTEVTYVYRVKDFCGRIVEASRVFTITNPIGPIITSVPPDYTTSCEDGFGPSPELFEAESNCGGLIELEVSDPVVNGTLGCSGSNVQYTYTARDECGRTAVHIQTISFINEGPVIDCPETLQIFNCQDGDTNHLIEAWIASVTATSSCGGAVNVSNNFNGNPGMCLGNNFTNVTFFATDECGVTRSCVGTIIITDTEAPIIFEAPQEVLVPCNAVTEQIFEEWLSTQGGAEAIDGCWGEDISWTTNPVNPQLNCAGGPQAIVVEFIATDGCGNSSSVTGIFNTKLPPNMINVSGNIKREDSEAVANVQIGIAGGTAGVPDMDYTTEDGAYGIPELDYEENLSLVPYKNDDLLNGVSTYDLVLLQRHLLNIDQLDSPYKRIAADVNNSGSISTFDILLLRRAILFIDDEFMNNTSWRFVDADFVFPNAENPFETSFPEVFNLGAEEEIEANFVGVKVGDLDLTAVTNSLMPSNEDRSGLDDLNLSIADQQLSTGKQYEIMIKAKNFDQIEGFQFTLTYNTEDLEILEIRPADLVQFSEANVGTVKREEGVFTISWNADRAIDLKPEEGLFILNIEAKTNQALNELISINSKYTPAEAYQHGNLMNIALDFDNAAQKEVAGNFELLQNRPNPFKEETVIGFYLPVSEPASLEVYDISGRLLTAISQDFDQGYNEVIISKENLPNNGVLIYKLVTKTDSATRKMILLD